LPDTPNVWPYWTALEEYDPEQDDTDLYTDTELFSAKSIIRLEMLKMGSIYCRACGGRGHRERDCPTHKKLSWLSGPGGVTAHVMVEIKACVRRDNAEAPSQAFGHCRLPKNLTLSQAIGARARK